MFELRQAHKQAQYEEAQPYYTRALLVEDEHRWSETPQVSVGLDYVAHTLMAEGRYEEAEKIYLWALDVSATTLGPESANSEYLRDQYAKYLRALGRDDEADQLSDG